VATHARLSGAGVTASQRGPWVRIAPHASTGPEAVGLLADALGTGD